MLAQAPAALGHDSPAEHRADDSVVLDAATEALHTRQTREASAADAARAARAVAGPEGSVGQWGPVVPWDAVGVHVALMPSGKILAFDSVGIDDRPTEAYPTEQHNRTRAIVYDPATGAQYRQDAPGFNLFCAGLGHLMDGRVFLAGGNKNPRFDGIVQTHTFTDPGSSWGRKADMQTERWYPTVTALSNGEMFIQGGAPIGSTDRPEVASPTGDGIRQLPNATLPAATPREEYPWTDVAPNGEVFVTGPMPAMRSLNPYDNSGWKDRGRRDAVDRRYGSHAMYDIGKVLVSGGGRPATASSKVVDLNAGDARVADTGAMTSPRRQHNLTVLADGSVLATGGLTGSEEQVDVPNAVYPAELWNPATGQWRTLAAMQVPRQYHSTAILLPDGRVLSSGGGICGKCARDGYLAKNAQVFAPPYLFRADGSPAPRPSIDWAPGAAAYGAPLEITTPQAGSIAKVALIRLGAVTHSVDMGQRYVPLQFSAAGDTVTATGPANANIAPPGPYMLVVVDGAGVPSVARMVTVSPSGAPGVALTAPAGETLTAPATLRLAANAADPDGIRNVEFFSGRDKLGEDATAPYTLAVGGVPAGSYSITARATDNAGVTSRSAAAGVTVVAPPPSRGTTAQAGAAARARAAARVVRISLASRVTLRRGTSRLPVKVRCLKACRGTLRVETRRGSLRGKVSFRMRKAGTRTLRVRLGPSLRKAARRRAQSLRVTVSVRDGRTTHVVRRNFTLRVR